MLIILVLVLVASAYGYGYNNSRRWNAIDSDRGLGSYESNYDDDDESPCKLNKYPPKPDTFCCGYDAVNTPFILGGEETRLGQYPWLVYIEYFNTMELFTTYRCGGSLISGQYVLTAAHCFAKKEFVPIAVHLGDHYIYHKGPDCMTAIDGTEECTDGDLRMPISIKDIIKPRGYYDRKTKSYKHDIALIKLRKVVPFTDYIRPICLPDFDIKSMKENTMLYVAGWGMTNLEPTWTLNNMKKAVDLPLKNNKVCDGIYERYFTRNIVCAGGKRGKDTCSGDSGGPLMLERRGQYFLVGIVSMGSDLCGSDDPALYTDVYKYRHWIKKNIGRKRV